MNYVRDAGGMDGMTLLHYAVDKNDRMFLQYPATLKIICGLVGLIEWLLSYEVDVNW